MEKYGFVPEDETRELQKEGSEGIVCPICGSKVSGHPPICPIHGSEPFEAKHGQKEKG